MSELLATVNTEAKIYLLALANKLGKHFDLHYSVTKDTEFFDFYAFHQNNFHKSFITKATVYEGFSIYEHMVFRVTKDCTEDDLLNFQSMLVRISPIFANPNKFHKKSIITGIIVCENSVSENLEKSIAKFFHRQNYKFCFHGWSETTCALISLADKKIYTLKGNKSLQELLSF